MVNTDRGRNEDGEPATRKYKWRYGPLRLAIPWIALVAGIYMAVRGFTAFDEEGSDGPVFFFLGLGLIVLAIVAFIVYRWMAKRGI